MSNILAALIVGFFMSFAAYSIAVAIDCNSGILVACEIRKAIPAYRVEP